MTEWIISSSVLILAVIVLRFALRGRISLRLQYALWALVLLRLLIPVSFFSSPVSVMLAAERLAGRPAAGFHDYVSGVQLQSGSFSAAGMTTEQAQEYGSARGWGTLYQMSTPQAPNQPSTYYFTRGTLGDMLEKWAARIWYAGIAAAGLCFIGANVSFSRKLRKTRKACRAAGCPLPVYIVETLPSPCLFGLFRPAIYVTPDVAGDETVFNYVLEHETTHWRQKDHIWSLLRCACLALHWYNPMAWAAALLSKQDAELACDEATIRRLGEARRTEYGRALIALTCSRRNAGALLNTATTMAGSKRGIRERITLIAKKPKTAVVTLVVVLLITAAVVGCTFTGAKKAEAIVPLTAAEIAQYNKTFEQILYDGKGNPSVNPLCLFLTSSYNRPEDLNLVKFLWYFPSEKDVTDQDEFEAIKAHKNWIGKPDAKLSELPFPIHRIPAAAVNEALKKYAGITLSDLSGVGTEKLIYLEKYDAYYTYTSDFGPGFINCTRGEKQGDIVRLYGENASLTLKIKGDGFLIVSYQEVKSAAADTLGSSAPAAPKPSVSAFGAASVLPSPLHSAKASASASASAPAPAPAKPTGGPFAASTGNIRDYIPDLLAGKAVSADALLPCLERFTRGTWSELDKAYGIEWFNAFWSALNNIALSISLADSGDQALRDFYIGKAYLTTDGAYTEGLDDIVMKQWTRDPVTYSDCLNERFSAKEAADLRQLIINSLSWYDVAGPFGLSFPSIDRSIYLGAYPVDFPFGFDLREKSRKSFKAESFGQGSVVESDGLQVTYLHPADGVFTVITVRADKKGSTVSGAAIGDTEKLLLAKWNGKLKKIDRISYDDEAWFGTNYDAVYSYTPAEGTKSILYLVRGGLVSGIEIINGLDGAMY